MCLTPFDPTWGWPKHMYVRFHIFMFLLNGLTTTVKSDAIEWKFHCTCWVLSVFSNSGVFILQQFSCQKGLCFKSYNIEETAICCWACYASAVTISCHLYVGVSIPKACWTVLQSSKYCIFSKMVQFVEVALQGVQWGSYFHLAFTPQVEWMFLWMKQIFEFSRLSPF